MRSTVYFSWSVDWDLHMAGADLISSFMLQVLKTVLRLLRLQSVYMCILLIQFN